MKWSVEIYTNKLLESKYFYCQLLDFSVKMDMEGFCILSAPDGVGFELLLCVPFSPFVQPIFHPAYEGRGLIFQLEVEAIDPIYDRFMKANISMQLPMIEEPFNGRHFTIKDPNGLLIDIVQFQN